MRSFLHIAVGPLISLLLLILGTSLSRRFASPLASEVMTIEEVMAQGERLGRLEHKAIGAGILITGALTFPLAYLLHLVNTRIFSPTDNPVYDGRRMEWWLLSGLTLSAAFAGPVIGVYARWLLGSESELFDRYVATRHGVNFRRANVVWAAIFIVITIVAGCAAWNNGIVIDQRGITVRLGWYYRHRTFQDVESVERSVEIPHSHDSAEKEILRLHFRVGMPGPLTLDENEKDRRPADLDRIEAYVRQRMEDQPSASTVRPEKTERSPSAIAMTPVSYASTRASVCGICGIS